MKGGGKKGNGKQYHLPYPIIVRRGGENVFFGVGVIMGLIKKIFYVIFGIIFFFLIFNFATKMNLFDSYDFASGEPILSN